VILLVHPDQEVLGIVVPDSTSVWPVTGHSGSKEKRRDGLIKQEVILDQLILLLLSHLIQWVVLALKNIVD